jgi:heme-degrading monooxygenase HmoA
MRAFLHTNCLRLCLAYAQWMQAGMERERMIVRMWHGRVPTSKADTYARFLNERAIPDYRSVNGNLSVNILERRESDVTHFITLTYWESLESIQGFAGENVDAAKYYPEDKEYLLEFEPNVLHYVVVGQAGLQGGNLEQESGRPL